MPKENVRDVNANDSPSQEKWEEIANNTVETHKQQIPEEVWAKRKEIL